MTANVCQMLPSQGHRSGWPSLWLSVFSICMFPLSTLLGSQLTLHLFRELTDDSLTVEYVPLL